jgi:hypothetical protein
MLPCGSGVARLRVAGEREQESRALRVQQWAGFGLPFGVRLPRRQVFRGWRHDRLSDVDHATQRRA